jgi:hypothetical protein
VGLTTAELPIIFPGFQVNVTAPVADKVTAAPGQILFVEELAVIIGTGFTVTKIGVVVNVVVLPLQFEINKDAEKLPVVKGHTVTFEPVPTIPEGPLQLIEDTDAPLGLKPHPSFIAVQAPGKFRPGAAVPTVAFVFCTPIIPLPLLFPAQALLLLTKTSTILLVSLNTI